MTVSFFLDSSEPLVSRIDNESAGAPLQFSLPGPSVGAAAVSVDGRYFAYQLPDPTLTTVVILDSSNGSIATVPGGPKGGVNTATFTPAGRLYLCGPESYVTLDPPYASANEVPLPSGAGLIAPDGSRIVLFQNQGTASIYDVEQQTAGPAFTLADTINTGYIQISPDGLRFSVIGVFDGQLAHGIFSAVDGSFIAATPPSILAQGAFLPDSVRFAHKSSDQMTVSLYDADQNQATTFSLSVLANDPPGATGAEYQIAGAADDEHLLMEVFGYVRRLSINDGSVASTPTASIAQAGLIYEQPLQANPHGETVTYFWANFVKSYEDPVITAG